MADAQSPTALIEWFAALSDPVRLRILRLLNANELSVGELAKSLQLPQSTVSRHLKVLNESGWIVKWSEGTTSRYRLDPSALSESAQTLWTLTSAHLTPDSEQHDQYSEDDRRMIEVLAERRGDGSTFFGRIGGEAGAWDTLRAELYGQMFTTEAMIGLLPETWTVADLGCGTGNCSELLSPIVRKVIAMDREPAMLEAARERLADRSNVDFVRGDLAVPRGVPITDDSVDAAIIMLVLHHLPVPDGPRDAVQEAVRTLRSGGLLLVVDMIEHDREIYRQSMGHQHLGFSERAVRAWTSHVPVEFVRYHRLRPDTSGKGPGLFAATLRKR